MVLSPRTAGPGTENREDGAVAIVVAVSMVILFGMLAIVIDLGYARSTRLEAQLAADSAALAAAQELSESAGLTTEQAETIAVAEAEPFVVNNLGITTTAWNSCPDCVQVNLAAQNVTITLPAQANSFFSGIYGRQTITVSGRSTATWSSGLPGDCLLCGLRNVTVFRDTLVQGGDVLIDGTLDNSWWHDLTVHPGNAFYGSLLGASPTVDEGFLSESSSLPVTDPFAGTAVADPWSVLPDPSDIPQTTVVMGGTCSPPEGSSVSYITTEYVAKCRTFEDGVYLVIPTSDSPRPIRLGSYSLVTGDVTGDNVLLMATCRNSTTGKPENCATASSRFGSYFDSAYQNVDLSGVVDTTGDLAPFQGFTLLVDPASLSIWQYLSTSSTNKSLHIEGNVDVPAQYLSITAPTTIAGQLIVGKDLTLGPSCSSTPVTINAPTTVLAPRPVGEVRLTTDG
jgi:Flp pilus assembly protein TadG